MAKTNLKYWLEVLALMLGFIYLILSYPLNLEFSIYTNFGNPDHYFYINPDQFNLSISRLQLPMGYYATPHPVCFRLRNSAESLFAPIISASDVRASLMTNATCADCNSFVAIGALTPQAGTDICKKIQVDQNMTSIRLVFEASWTAIGISRTLENMYDCTLQNMTDPDGVYLCNRTSAP